MEFKKGKNWWQFNLTKFKLIYFGPAQRSDRDKEGDTLEKCFKISSRRFKCILQKNKVTKKWVFHFGGCLTNIVDENHIFDYTIKFYRAK